MDPEATFPSIRGNRMPLGSGTTSARIPQTESMHFVCRGMLEWACGDLRSNKAGFIACVGRDLATVKCPGLGEGYVSAH